MAEDLTNIQVETNDKFGEVFFAWRILAYPQHERTRVWYIFMIVLAAILTIYSIYTANFLFALIIILVIFIIFLRIYAEGTKIVFQITDEGLTFGNEFFPYNRIKYFYIIYEPPYVKKIFFSLKGLAAADLSVSLEDIDPLEVRKKLIEYLEEDVEKEQQSLDDQLETILKL